MVVYLETSSHSGPLPAASLKVESNRDLTSKSVRVSCLGHRPWPPPPPKNSKHSVAGVGGGGRPTSLPVPAMSIPYFVSTREKPGSEAGGRRGDVGGTTCG
ncbi:hypothetical protein MUK42_34940 [Musa troglodytarum]|uniref:Uncharacterized protein n=1 Tax=Musa troglodytarum TaxID=320322 RepID=A0A9E7H1V8_9LILI|nr:hypothetical protein MUK42_34940 [Musa troglodytarum]